MSTSKSIIWPLGYITLNIDRTTGILVIVNLPQLGLAGVDRVWPRRVDWMAGVVEESAESELIEPVEISVVVLVTGNLLVGSQFLRVDGVKV